MFCIVLELNLAGFSKINLKNINVLSSRFYPSDVKIPDRRFNFISYGFLCNAIYVQILFFIHSLYALLSFYLSHKFCTTS